jgi:hypothetical protein
MILLELPLTQKMILRHREGWKIHEFIEELLPSNPVTQASSIQKNLDLCACSTSLHTEYLAETILGSKE